MNIGKSTLFFSLLLIFLLSDTVVHAQQWQWVSSAGGPNSDKALDIDIDRYGNQYICGYYNTPNSGGDVNFGAIYPGSDFGKEAFVAKIDSTGQWQWVKSAFGGWDERALGLCVDKVNDCIYVTGTAWIYTDFGSCTGTSFPGSYDNIFIGKFDLLGNCQWLVGAGGQYDDHGFDLVTDKQGNIYLTGFIGNTYGTSPTTATFGSLSSAPIPAGDSLAFVAKMNPAGVFQWVRTFDATDGERDNRIAIDSLDNVYITGGFHETAQFGLFTETAIGGRDIFVVKYDALGNLLWVNTAGSPLDDRGNGITRGPDNQLYVTGEFRDQVGFGVDTLNNNGGPGGRDIFVAKINRYGGWMWAKRAGSDAGSDRGDRITSNKSDMIFLTGQFRGDARFGNDTLFNPADSVQAFVAAIDTSGKWHWALQAGGSIEDRGTGVAADDSCNIYACGFYELTATFNTMNVTAEGRKDIYVANIPSACVHDNVGITEAEVFLPLAYPNPGTGHFTIDLRQQHKDLSVIVYNIVGEVIIDQRYQQVDKLYLNIDAADGIYFVRLLDPKGKSSTLKLIKE